MELTFDARVTIKGKPFVCVIIDGKEVGQLTPLETKHLGLRVLESGIEAERDAGFLKFMLEMDPTSRGLVHAGAMLRGLREHRQQADADGRDVAEEARTEGDEEE